MTCGLRSFRWAHLVLGLLVIAIALALFVGPALAATAPSFSIDNATAAEDSGTITFRVRKHGRLNALPSIINVYGVDGTAKFGSDFGGVNQSVTFGPSETVKMVSIHLVNDAVPEPTETFTVKLHAVSNARLYDGTAIGTITDNDVSAPAPTPSPVPAPSTSVAYDASVGMGVSADGFADLPLRSGAHRYFVDSTSGSDDNGCSGAQQASKPLRTIAAAFGCVGTGLGDQVLLAEGTRYSESLPWLPSESGYSAQYPTVVQSYDPADPMNEAKYGRGDQRSARPVITVMADSNGNGPGYGYLAIRGLDFNPGNVAARQLTLIGQVNYLLIENNIFRYTGLSIDRAGIGSQAQHHVIRGNSFYGEWNTAGRTGGVYDAGVDNVTLEDNVFWHNGWKVGASRDDDPSIGGATVFSHPFYLQTDTSSLVRRNLVMDGAGDGANVRGDTLFTENVGIDNPICIGLGGGPQYNIDRPAGVKFEASYNACIGNEGVRSDHRLGWGITTANGVSGSSVHHNLIVRSKDPSAPDTQGFSNYAAFDQPSYADYHHNLMWSWVVAPNLTYFDQQGALASYIHTNFNYNQWDGPAQGTNTNSHSLTFPNPYTEEQLWIALGCANETTCAQHMVETPELRWGAKVRAMIFVGYGL